MVIHGDSWQFLDIPLAFSGFQVSSWLIAVVASATVSVLNITGVTALN